MKVTYSNLIEAAQALDEISQKDLEIKEALELARLIRLCCNEIKIFEEQRLKLCEKHGKLNEQGTNYDFSDEGMRAFSKDFSKLLNLEINIPSGKVSLKSKGLKLKAATVLACDSFVKFAG